MYIFNGLFGNIKKRCDKGECEVHCYNYKKKQPVTT